MDTVKEKAIAITHEFLQAGGELPFSLEIGPQLISFSSKPAQDIDVAKLINLIQMDPGLTTNILQLANSVYFSSSTRIVSLRRAMVQIGIEEALNFIQMILYRKSFPKFPEIEGFFSDKDYWNHSWACAFACKSLGHPTIGSKLLPGELYIAGLLHGIGKMVLTILRPEEFLQCLENSVNFQQSLPETEMDILGTTDTDIACELLKVYHLPENVCQAIKHFHNPGEAEEDGREFAGLLQLAYVIANTSGIGNILDEFNFNISKTWICQQPHFPLYDEKIREKFLQNIYSMLEKKRSTIEAVEPNEPDPIQAEEQDQEENSDNSTSTTGLLNLFIRWFKALFK